MDGGRSGESAYGEGVSALKPAVGSHRKNHPVYILGAGSRWFESSRPDWPVRFAGRAFSPFLIVPNATYRVPRDGLGCGRSSRSFFVSTDKNGRTANRPRPMSTAKRVPKLSDCPRSRSGGGSIAEGRIDVHGGQPGEHQADRGQLHQRFAAVGPPFGFATRTAAAPQPAEGAIPIEQRVEDFPQVRAAGPRRGAGRRVWRAAATARAAPLGRRSGRSCRLRGSPKGLPDGERGAKPHQRT